VMLSLPGYDRCTFEPQPALEDVMRRTPLSSPDQEAALRRMPNVAAAPIIVRIVPHDHNGGGRVSFKWGHLVSL
jgi:hypothetical protein